MKRWIIFVLLFFVFGIFFFELIQRDAGYVLVSLYGKTLETSFWFAVGVLVLISVILFIVFKSVKAIVRSLVDGRSWFSSRRYESNERRFQEGMLNFLVGDYKHATKRLLSVPKKAPLPIVRAITLAQSYAKLGEFDKALDALFVAQVEYPYAQLWLCKAKIPLLIAAHRHDDVALAIKELKTLSPKDADLPRLQHLNLSEGESWQDASQFVSKKPNQKKLSSNDVKDTYVHALDQLAHDTSIKAGQVDALWEKVPRKMKTDADVLTAYAHLLFASKQHALLQELIVYTLPKLWLPELLNLYAKLDLTDVDAQLKQAERWLKKHENDKDLLLTLGILSIKNQLWGKGRSYLDRCNALSENVRATYFLGFISDKVDEPDRAHRYYKRAAELAHKE